MHTLFDEVLEKPLGYYFYKLHFHWFQTAEVYIPLVEIIHYHSQRQRRPNANSCKPSSMQYRFDTGDKSESYSLQWEVIFKAAPFGLSTECLPDTVISGGKSVVPLRIVKPENTIRLTTRVRDTVTTSENCKISQFNSSCKQQANVATLQYPDV